MSSSPPSLAALNCLIKFFGLTIPLTLRPNLVLKAEQELGITAGLQDRVIQVGGAVRWRSKHKRNTGTTESSCHQEGGWRERVTPFDPGVRPRKLI